jgi:hypothetical protein
LGEESAVIEVRAVWHAEEPAAETEGERTHPCSWIDYRTVPEQRLNPVRDSQGMVEERPGSVRSHLHQLCNREKFFYARDRGKKSFVFGERFAQEVMEKTHLG